MLERRRNLRSGDAIRLSESEKRRIAAWKTADGNSVLMESIIEDASAEVERRRAENGRPEGNEVAAMESISSDGRRVVRARYFDAIASKTVCGFYDSTASWLS